MGVLEGEHEEHLIPENAGESGRDESPDVFLDDLKAKTPAMSMMDLRNAYSTLLVGAYQSIPWDSKFDWFD